MVTIQKAMESFSEPSNVPRSVEEKTEISSQSDEITDMPPPSPPKEKKVRKSKAKTYQVRIGDSTVIMTRSSPDAATRAAVRAVIKELPLQTPVRVYTKSKTKIHPYLIERDYDTSKFRRFSMRKTDSSAVIKKLSEHHEFPDDFVNNKSVSA